MDLDNVIKKHSLLKNIWQLAAEFHLELNDENAPDIFEVKIWKDSEGFYYPSPSHYLQRENDHDKYIPTYTHRDSIEKAFEEVFTGLGGTGNRGNTFHKNSRF